MGNVAVEFSRVLPRMALALLSAAVVADAWPVGSF